MNIFVVGLWSNSYGFEGDVMGSENIGSDFDEFLHESGTYSDVTFVAEKRVIAWQIEREVKAKKPNSATMAIKMRNSCTGLSGRYGDE